MTDTESAWWEGADRARIAHERKGPVVKKMLFRGLSQRGRPYAAGVGVLGEQTRISGAIIWSRVVGGVMHWIVQPLAYGYMGVQRDD